MSEQKLVSLIPAAGRGSRLGNIPCSKEIMPLGFSASAETNGVWKAKTAIEAHIHSHQQAGASRMCITVSAFKHDIMRYLGNGSRFGLAITYLFQEQLNGMPAALDLASPWVQDATVLFSMPDTLITPGNFMGELYQTHHSKRNDVTLGLFATDEPHKFGMVDFDAEHQATFFNDKPATTDLKYMWGCAVWSPAFTDLLHNEVLRWGENSAEFVLSNVFESALANKMSVGVHLYEGGVYHDIGTPTSFQDAVVNLAIQQLTPPELN